MNKFCQECGHEAKANDMMCTNCGTKIIDMNEKQQSASQSKLNTEMKPPKGKQPMSKQQKILISVVGALAVLIIGFSVWANLYFSKDSTENRFYKAIENKDSEQLEQLLIHENGSSATKSELDAFIKLADDLNENELGKLVNVVPDGKFLGIFQKHKVQAIQQFAYYSGPTEGLEMQFNNSKIKDQKENDGITYGPLLPGTYTVNVSLDNAFGKSTTEIEVTLANSNSEKVAMDKLPIGEASVNVVNYDGELMSESHLLVNGNKVEIDENGDSATFGPLFLDGSQEVKVIANYPWGEVESKPFSIDSNHIEVDASLVSGEQLEKIKEVLLTFGEEMQDAKAQLSTEVFTSVTDILRDDFLYFEIDPLLRENIYYTGKLNKVELNADNIWPHNGLVVVHSMFDYSYAFFEAGEEPPALEDDELHSFVGLAFDETTQEWKVSYIEADNHEGVNPTDTLEGTEVVYAPSDEAITVSGTDLRAEMQEFMEAYTIASVDAINFRDISHMSPYLTSDGPRYAEAKDYIAYLENAGITEEYVSTEVVDVLDNGDGSYLVTTHEEFIIFYPTRESQNRYDTVVEVKKENGSWKVHKLVSTKGI